MPKLWWSVPRRSRPALALAQTSPSSTTVTIFPPSPTPTDSVTFTAVLSPSGACSELSRGYEFFFSNGIYNQQQVMQQACPTFTFSNIPAGTYTLRGGLLGTSCEPGGPNPPVCYSPSNYQTTFTVAAPSGPNSYFQGQYAMLFKGQVDGPGGLASAAPKFPLATISMRRPVVPMFPSSG